MKGMKVLLIIGVVILINSLIKNNDINNSSEIRVRILANSNSKEDQAEKYYLKNILVPILKKHPQKPSVKEIRDDLFKSIDDEQLKKKIKVEYKICAYRAQSYNEKFLPAGEYLTLLITIGNGKGQNWWTVLYPEFFGVSFEDEDHNIKYKSYFYEKFIKK